NFDANPSVVGVRGVMESYRFALSRVKLYGPTNFKPVIQEVAKKASRISNKTDGSRYQVLLIITDGAISDMAATKQAIIA
ncbi:Copine, partial [Teladorsagia circumcincta]